MKAACLDGALAFARATNDVRPPRVRYARSVESALRRAKAKIAAASA